MWFLIVHITSYIFPHSLRRSSRLGFLQPLPSSTSSIGPSSPLSDSTFVFSAHIACAVRFVDYLVLISNINYTHRFITWSSIFFLSEDTFMGHFYGTFFGTLFWDPTLFWNTFFGTLFLALFWETFSCTFFGTLFGTFFGCQKPDLAMWSGPTHPHCGTFRVNCLFRQRQSKPLPFIYSLPLSQYWDRMR